MTQRLAIRADLDPSGVQAGAAVVRSELGAIGASAQASNAKVGAAAALSSEKMARYGTTIGMMTGSFTKLGVSNDMIARGLTMTIEIVSGLASKIYLVVGAIGALAAAITDIIQKHREHEAAVKAAGDAIVDRYAGTGLLGGFPGVHEEVEGELGTRVERIKEIRRELTDLELVLAGTRQDWQKALQPDTGGFFERTRDKVKMLTAEMLRLGDEAVKLQGALGVGVYTVPEVVVRPEPRSQSAEEAAEARRIEEARRRVELQLRMGSLRPERSNLGPGRLTEGVMGGESLRRSFQESLDNTIKIIPDKGTEMLKAWRENVVDPMRQSLANGIYGAFQAGKQGVNELGQYFLDFFTDNILKALSEKIAMSLAGSLSGGGGFLTVLFTGSFRDKDASGAKSMNLEWRKARG